MAPEHVSTASPVVRAAQPEDVPLLLELFRELAEYEHLEHELHATEELLGDALFGRAPGGAGADRRARHRRPRATRCSSPRSRAFSRSGGCGWRTCSCARRIRGAGVGKALLAAVAAHVWGRGGERLEWAALDWNELALGFYRRIGAQTMNEWITHRLVGEELERLAGESASGPIA